MTRCSCSVPSCNNRSYEGDGDLTFFRLPANPDRYSQWLRLMGRMDLLDKSYLHYYICDVHFSNNDILISHCRKILKKNAMPALLLPTPQSADVETQTESETETRTIRTYTKAVQSERMCIDSKATQTTAALVNSCPVIVKLKQELAQMKKEVKQTEKSEKELFQELCDKFLSKDLAALVKEQVNSKKKYNTKVH